MKNRYEIVKHYLVTEIRKNRWQENERVLSENELVKAFSVSRMTARRAIKELESEGVLYSIRGKGTFVTPAKSHSSAIELRNIADEIRARNHDYRCQVLELDVKQDKQLAIMFGLNDEQLYYSEVVHFENNVPIQYEKRYVNPTIATEYLSLDLEKTTANEYLTALCPVSSVEHKIEAVRNTNKLSKWLQIKVDEPCLKVTRMTRYEGQLVSLAMLYHPGDRFVLGTHFEMQS